MRDGEGRLVERVSDRDGALNRNTGDNDGDWRCRALGRHSDRQLTQPNDRALFIVHRRTGWLVERDMVMDDAVMIVIGFVHVLRRRQRGACQCAADGDVDTRSNRSRHRAIIRAGWWDVNQRDYLRLRQHAMAVNGNTSGLRVTSITSHKYTWHMCRSGAASV